MRYYIELMGQGGKGDYIFSPFYYGGHEEPLRTTSIHYAASVSDAKVFTDLTEANSICDQLRELTFSPEVRTISSN